MQIAFDVFVVVGVNVEAFGFAGAVAEGVGFFGVLGANGGLSEIGFDLAESGEGHGEIGIEGDGLLEEGRGGFLAFIRAGLHAEAVGFEGFEGGGGGFVDGRIEFLNGGERFAEFAADICGGLAESGEDVIFILGFGGGAGEGFAGGTIDGVEDEIVGVADLRDGAFHDGGGLGALANLAGEFVGDAGGGGLSHVLQGLLHLAVGENVEEGGLRELGG